MNGTLTTTRQHLLRLSFTSMAALFVALAIAGAVRAYSPVPYWDMWSGYLPFLDQAASGDWTVWWRQHNEHRILLTRLLFWMDLRWFGGASWFLLAANYVLIALGAVLACRILRELPVPPGRDADMHALMAFAVIWLFFWSQWENLTWGFQSQFIMAQMLPLAALYMLYRSLKGGSATFALACLLGLMCAGTMANGILALPLMTAYALMTGQGARRIGVLALLTALMLVAYFHGYVPVSGHGSLTQALREHPVLFVRYVLAYLGNPFFFAFGTSDSAKYVAQFAGLCFVAAALVFAWRILRKPRQAALPLAMLAFISYICGTAIGTAGGRLIFGLEQALSSRYTTPALMAWFALLVLLAPALLALRGWRRGLAWGGFAALVLSMLPFQLQAQQSREDQVFERAVGALAIEMRIQDMVEIGHVYPDPTVLAMSEQASNHQRSVFGLYPYRGARAAMGTAIASGALPECQGFLDIADTIEGDAQYLRVDGWLYEPVRKMTPQVVRILSAEGKQVGYALGGKSRADVAAAVSKNARLAGYRGYLSSAKLGPTITLRGEGPAGPFCQIQVKAPVPPPFTFKAQAPSAAQASVDSTHVVEGNEWLGMDYYKSQIPGLRVYGSFIQADADVGAIELQVKRGDRLYYRSGPTAGRQFIEINGNPMGIMPLAIDWILLDFSNEALPNETFTVKLLDKGNGWGEWSAIALKSN